MVYIVYVPFKKYAKNVQTANYIFFRIVQKYTIPGLFFLRHLTSMLSLFIDDVIVLIHRSHNGSN